VQAVVLPPAVGYTEGVRKTGEPIG
jgi:hypothetical protein